MRTFVLTYVTFFSVRYLVSFVVWQLHEFKKKATAKTHRLVRPWIESFHVKNFPGFFRQVSPFVSSRSCSSRCSTYFFFTDWMLIIFSTFILMTIILKDVKSCVWGGNKWVIELRIYLPRNYTGWCNRKGNFSIPSPSVHSCCKYLPVPGQVSR